MPVHKRGALALLALACSAAGGLPACLLVMGRIGEGKRAIADYRSRIDRLSGVLVDEEGARLRLNAIEGLLAEVEERSSRKTSTSISEFGREVLSLLSKNGILASKYSVISMKDKKEFELSFRCEAAALFRFLRDASGEGRAWAIPYASIRAESAGGQAEVAMRLTQ
jgi:hypothetical protein